MSTLKVNTITDVSAGQKATLKAGTACTMNPVATTTVATQAHGLGAQPSFVDAYLECLTADQGYATGDRVQMQFKDNAAGNFGYMVEWDAINIMYE